MAKCETCQVEFTADVEECPNCGTVLEQTVASPDPLPPEEPASSEAGDEPGIDESMQADESGTPGSEPEEAAPAPEEPASDAATSPTQSMARLTLLRAGEPTSEVFPVGNGNIVGRFDTEKGPVDVDLARLPEAEYISRHHAQFVRGTDNAWVIRDLQSINGVFLCRSGGDSEKVNGEASLADGDVIALGNAKFEFRVG